MHCRVEGDKSGLVTGRALLLSPTNPDPFSLPSPQNKGQTSPNFCGLQKPVLRLGWSSFSVTARCPLQIQLAAPVVEAASRTALFLFPAGPISQKMYAMLPCGGIGVSRAPAGGGGHADGSPSVGRSPAQHSCWLAGCQVPTPILALPLQGAL